MSEPAPPALVIRDIEEVSEIKQVEEVQKEVWGFGDLDVIPMPILKPIRELGGLLIGAFDGATLAGFVFGFLGREGGHIHIHSQMLAVRRAYRNLGLGSRLKLAQRDRVLAAGIQRITWTFDPLQSLNAHLNFGKLGVVCQSYRINFYGESTSSHLHSNGTDRLLVTWLAASERVAGRLAGGFDDREFLEGLPDAATALAAGPDNAPLPNPGAYGSAHVLMEIPRDIDGLPRELAWRWRLATRHAFTTALSAGYLVEEFCRSAGVYVLARDKSIEDVA